MRKQLSLSKKFWIAFAIILVLVVVMEVLIAITIRKTEASLEEFITRDTPRLLALMEMRQSTTDLDVDIKEIVHNPEGHSDGQESPEMLRNTLLSHTEEFTYWQSRYTFLLGSGTGGQDGEVQKRLDKLTLYKDRITILIADILRSNAGEDLEYIEAKHVEIESTTQELFALLEQQLASETLEQHTKRTEIIHAEAQAGLTISILAVLLLFIFIFLGFYVIIALIRPIKNFTRALEHVSKGDLNVQIPVTSGDELGILADTFNTMSRRIEESQAELVKKATELQETLAKVSTFAAEADTQRNLYELMLASIGDAVIVTDSNKQITLVNIEAERLFLYTKEDLLGKQAESVIQFVKKDEHTPVDPMLWDRALKGTEPISLQIDINVLDKKGGLIPVSAALSPIVSKTGENEGLIAVIRDIREQRQLEETRISFISVASHQLRTPLTSMRWFSEMLLAGDAGEINEEQKHFVQRIYEGTDRMINLVGLLLQIARVEARRLKVDPKPTDLKQVTKGVELSLKANLDAKKQMILISSEPEVLPQLMVDQEVIWQVIQNLLSNAIRYSPEKATIVVHIKQGTDIVEYAVVDKGIGIPDKEKDKIFEKFYRAENALKYVPEGSGLGLSLVKSLVEGWGGTIRFDSKEGLGTTFTFTIPARGMDKREGDVSIQV